jgi:cell division protease FtsH
MAKTLLDKEVLDHNDLKELLGDHPEGKYPEGIFNHEEKRDNLNGSDGYIESQVVDDGDSNETDKSDE